VQEGNCDEATALRASCRASRGEGVLSPLRTIFSESLLRGANSHSYNLADNVPNPTQKGGDALTGLNEVTGPNVLVQDALETASDAIVDDDGIYC
jgi:hypothetical protein